MSDLLSLNPPDGHPMSVADENRLQERLEELAQEEARCRQGPFDEWLADFDADTIAGIVANLIHGTEDSCQMAEKYAGWILNDYIQWRTSDPRFIEDVQQLMAREDGEDE